MLLFAQHTDSDTPDNRERLHLRRTWHVLWGEAKILLTALQVQEAVWQNNLQPHCFFLSHFALQSQCTPNASMNMHTTDTDSACCVLVVSSTAAAHAATGQTPPTTYNQYTTANNEITDSHRTTQAGAAAKHLQLRLHTNSTEAFFNTRYTCYTTIHSSATSHTQDTCKLKELLLLQPSLALLTADDHCCY